MYEIKIPSPGESITSVTIAGWLVENKSYVSVDQEIAELESEKATLQLLATANGIIDILFETGSVVEVGTVVCRITPGGAPPENAVSKGNGNTQVQVREPMQSLKEKKNYSPKITPLAKNIIEVNNIKLENLPSDREKITANDVLSLMQGAYSQSHISNNEPRSEKRVIMSPLRKKLGERLVAVKNQTAMLTTFNEVDMSSLIAIRIKNRDNFANKHNIKLGYMSFFAKAVSESLKLHPDVNSRIENESIVFPDYIDLGIAVQTDKGLMVPVIRDAGLKSIPELEKEIFSLAEKARKFKISLDEMSGGTFTISNGGVFGSLLSTPVLNPPQSAILGLHAIQDRPVAIEARVEVRPMMYLALSYDHRVLDGRDSVLFLKQVKEFIENPKKLIEEKDEIVL